MGKARLTWLSTGKDHPNVPIISGTAAGGGNWQSSSGASTAALGALLAAHHLKRLCQL